jgi:hypothetical protein
MSLIVVDVESDGPIPGPYSMVCFGAVLVDRPEHSFYGQTKPINEKWDPEALEISGFSREDHLTFPDPKIIMESFRSWIYAVSDNRPVMISDNIAYDWQWINWYFHNFIGNNPFGFSGRRIGDIYSGLMKDIHQTNKWKYFRKTKHTHNPVDDARGNVEALNYMFDNMGLKR